MPALTAEHLAYVGRQAIFDRRRRTVGYELLYRNSEENRARFDDANQATAATMVNAFVDFGLETIAGALPVWVNLPESFLRGALPIPLPPARTVVEVLEDVPVTPALLDGLHALRGRGFELALDDFLLTPETRPLLPLASYVKVDVLHVAPAAVEAQYAELRPFGVPLLAEKITTRAEYDFLFALGFDYFQGHFFDLPTIARGKRMPHDRTRLIQILARVYDPASSLASIEALVGTDVGLATRLIRLASSAALSRGATIGTVGQAITRLGAQQVAAVVLLIVTAGFDDKPLELTRRALIRARMCELLARSSGLPAPELFTAGLLSMVDCILDQPLDEVLRGLAISPVVREALLGARGAPGAQVVETAIHQDRGEFAALAAAGVSSERVTAAWRDAVAWANELFRLL